MEHHRRIHSALVRGLRHAEIGLIVLPTATLLACETLFELSSLAFWMGFVVATAITILIGTRYLSRQAHLRQSILRTMENRYQIFVETVPIGIYRTTPQADGVLLKANRAFVQLLGYESEDDLKKAATADVYLDSVGRTRFIENLIARGSVSEVELQFKRKDGTPIWGAVTARLVHDDETGMDYCDCSMKDITRYKQIEAALVEGEQRYRNLFDHSLNGFALHQVVTNPQGEVIDYIFLEANQAFEEMTGLRVAEITGRRATEVLPGIDQALPIIYGHVAQTGEPARFEQFFASLNRYYDIAAFSPRHGQFATLFWDITARVQAEMALRESEAQYHELFEGVDDIITVHDIEGRILDINGAASRQLGYTRDELLLMNVTDIDEPGEYADGFQARLHKQLAHGKLSGISGVLITKDGRRLDIECTTKVITYRGQLAILAAAHDVTERKLAELQLRDSETRYRGIVEDQTELVVRWTPDGIRTFVNDAYCRYFGLPRESFIGNNFYSLVVEEDRQQIFEKLARLTPDSPMETDVHRSIKPDGSICWQEWVDRGFFDDAGNLIELQSVGRDVTERSLMADQVRQERDRAQQYLDIAGVMLVVLNERCETTLINRKGREVLGYSEAELIGRPWFKMCLPPREHERVQNTFRQLFAGEAALREHYESHVVTKTGEERLISWRIQVLYDAAGNVVGALSSGEDITERRLAENALREQTQLAEALADIAALINSSLDPRRVFERILTNLVRVVPHDYADIMMIEAGLARITSFHCLIDVGLDEVALRAIRLPLNETANLHRMAETGQSLIVPDIGEFTEWVDVPETRWIRSYLGAPIQMGGETIGFINLNSTQPCFFTEEHVGRLQAFADQAAIAINNAHSYDDLERRVIERTIDLSVRNAVAETLSNTLEIAPMLNGVLRTTVERIGVQGGAIHLLSDEGTTLSLAACYGISPETLEQVTGFTPGGADLGVFSEAREFDTHTTNIPHETGIYAVLSVPIWRQGQIQGIITLAHNELRPWRAEETRMLDAIGRQIGVALVNARLYSDAVRDEAHIRTILQSVADGLLVFDRNDNLTLMNSAAQALFAFYPLESGGTARAAVLLWTWLRTRSTQPDEPTEFSLPTIPLLLTEEDAARCLTINQVHATMQDRAWPCWLVDGSPSEVEMRRCPVFERIPRRALQAHSASVRDADDQMLGTVIVLHDVTYFRQLDELKGRFVSTVSHELRTPLSVVLLQVSTLLKYYDRLPEAQRREMVGEIQQQAHNLRELVEDILELSRFDARRSMPQKQWFDLVSHSEELLDTLQPPIQDKHLKLDVSRNLQSSYIYADPQQVMRVLRNLLGNAIKYTPEGGQIMLRLEQTGDEVSLSVSDTGIGIAPEEQLYIFDRFFRAEQASRMASGHGLGLSITKEIVDLHGGRIDLASTQGEGSTFTVYLPVYREG